MESRHIALTLSVASVMTSTSSTCTQVQRLAVSLAREVRVVIVDYLNSDKKRQTRKFFFSIDTSISDCDIFDIYRARFQLEFVFRDAKPFTGLTHCQTRNKEALSFAFNALLTSVNLARAFARQQGMNL